MSFTAYYMYFQSVHYELFLYRLLQKSVVSTEVDIYVLIIIEFGRSWVEDPIGSNHRL